MILFNSNDLLNSNFLYNNNLALNLIYLIDYLSIGSIALNSEFHYEVIPFLYHYTDFNLRK